MVLHFQDDVLHVVQAFEDLGNPFMEESTDLLDLDQSLIMPKEVLDSVKNVRGVGLAKYRQFLDERIFHQKEPFGAPMKQTRLPLFKNILKAKRKPRSAAASLKDQHSKASQILLAAQAGRNIPEKIFGHENCEYPPSLSKDGHIYHGSKCEILDCLSDGIVMESRADSTCAILDGAVVVQMLYPRNTVTFEEYCSNVFVPYVLKWLTTNDRVDIVWDVYRSDSLKSAVREQRGTGMRRRVTLNTKIPGNWQSFLKVDLNKQELFSEISQYMRNLKLPEVSPFIHSLQPGDYFYHAYSRANSS